MAAFLLLTAAAAPTAALRSSVPRSNVFRPKGAQSTAAGLPVQGRHVLASVLLSVFAAVVPPDAPVLAPEPAQALSKYVKSSDSGIGLFVNKDGNSILRLTLPRIAELPDLFTAQELAETIKLRFDQVGYNRDPVWIAAAGDAGQLQRVLEKLEPEISEKAPDSVRAKAEGYIAKIKPNLQPLQAALKAKNINDALRLQYAVATDLANLQQVLFPPKTLPYEVPEEYADRPQLRGRAVVEMRLAKGKGNTQRFCAPASSIYSGRYGMSYSEIKESAEDIKGSECAQENSKDEATIRMTLDGYHAPLTAGNFVYLVRSGFYNNMPITQLTDLTIQTGEPQGGKSKPRPVPLELFYKRDSEPTYSFTSDDDRRGAETMSLPFQSYGALGMARDTADLGAADNDSATTQFFFVKYDQALIPPGRNTLDGAYSCFGYTSDGAIFLKQVEKGDVIVSAKVVSGEENLVLPGGS